MARRSNLTVVVDTTVLDGIIKGLGGNTAEAVKKAAFAIEGRAKVKAPVDIGALRASIYTSLKDGTSQDAMADARALNPNAVITPLPVPRDDHAAYVGPSVEYGLFVEMGTTRMAGRPYLQPAVRETEDEFRKLVGNAVVNK